MSEAGMRVTLLAGKTKPLPLPPGLLETFSSLEVTQDDERPSAFQIAATRPSVSHRQA